MSRPSTVAVGAVGLWAAIELVAWLSGLRPLLAAAAVPLVLLPIALAKWRRREFDPVDPIWLVMLALLFAYGLVPALELFDPEPFESVQGHLRLSPPHLYVASWIGGVGIIAFAVAYFSGATERPVAALAPRLATPRPKVVAITGGVLVGCGLLAIETVLVLSDASTLSASEILRGGLREATLTVTDGRGYLAIGYLALSLGLLCLVTAAALAGKPGTRAARWVVPVALAAVAVSLLMFGLVLGSRQNAVVTALGSLIIVHLVWRRIPVAAWAAGLVVAAVFGVVALASRNADGLTLNPLDWAGGAAKTFDGFNFTVTGLARAERPLYGQTFVEDLGLTYLPRFLFEGKPTTFGIVRAEEVVIGDVPSGTFPPGLLMEGYLNLGILGVVLVAVATALLLRGAYDLATRSGGAFAVILLAYLMSNVSAIARGLGPVLPTLLVVGVMLAPLLVPDRLFGRVGSSVWRGASVAALALAVVAALAIPLVVDPITAPDDEPEPRLAQGSPVPAVVGLPEPTTGAPSMRLFWSSWCADCEVQLQSLDRFADGDRVQVIAFQDEAGRAEAALAGRPWATALDDGSATIADYGVGQLPTTVVLTPDARLACTLVGVASEEQVEAALDRTAETGRCS